VTSRAALRVIVALAAVVVGAGALSLCRPGYTPDEEYTLFAVRGISAHGVPLLPSGLLYDRGLAYSYLSWLAATLSGVELPAFRALSLLSGAAVLVVGYMLIRTSVSAAAGVAAALLVAMSVPFWAAITTGRFYAPFLLTCVAILAVVSRLRSPETPGASARQARTCVALASLAFVSRLTHELAFTLMAIPVAGLLLDRGRHAFTPPDPLRPLRNLRLRDLRHLRLRDLRHLRLRDLLHLRLRDLPHLRLCRRPWAVIAAAIGVGLIAAQSVLAALHVAIPAGEGGGIMLRRFFLWQVLNLFERPHGAPLGLVLAALVVAWLLVPRRAGISLAIASTGAVTVLALGVALTSTAAPVSVALVRSVVAGGLTYPLDMFWDLAGDYPVMVWMAMALLVARLCGAGGEWTVGERTAHLAWVGWVSWFGVIESGITINYVLLPTVCMLAAIGIDLVAIGQHALALRPGRIGLLLRDALVVAGLLIVVDHWPRSTRIPARLAEARPTIDVPAIEGVRDYLSLQPADRIACTDELACLILVGRVDAWLALDDFVRERFVVIRGATPVGVYAGAPVVFRPVDLFEPGSVGIAPARVIVVDVFKEYPVGNSVAWLPRALAADGLEARTLLLTGQARVVEVVGRESGIRSQKSGTGKSGADR
jgi:hypothetical protein